MELDGELHGTVEDDVMWPGRRDDRAVTRGKNVGLVRGVFEDEGQLPGADDQSTPDTLGDPMGRQQPGGNGRLCPER
jgi:hypothetical protein